MTVPEFPEETASPPEKKGFLAALFDLNFESFVALRFIKVIYVIAIVFIGLAALGLFFAALAGGDPITALAALVFMFFYLIMIRVSLEVIVLLFRIGQDTAAIRESTVEA